jgi:hypothetical protein
MSAIRLRSTTRGAGCFEELVMRSALAFFLLALACAPAESADGPCARPALRGSFVQPALGDRWTLKQWQNEFEYMRRGGLDEMLIQWTADSKENTTIFPSTLAGYKQNTQHDVVERALNTADASGARVYLGLQINDDWWTNYIGDGPWLKNEAKIATALADDLWKRYRRHPSLAGWYLPFEVDNVETSSPQWDNLVAFYRTVGHHLHTLTPGKPVAISPFYNTQEGPTSSQWQTMWEYVLKRSPIDVLALQDGVGAGHATKAALPEWFSAVRNAIHNARPSMQLWADTETFHHDDATMPIHSMVNDMCAVQSYVSNYLSFSFNHYLSPQQANPLYYQTYMDYLATGKVEAAPPTTPANVRGVAVDSASISLSWAASTDNMGVVGYKVRRDGAHVAARYSTDTAYVDSGLNAGTTYSYQVKAFDAAGNGSEWSAPINASTPPPQLYPANLSLGKPYTASMPADPTYPDSAGVELTDGVLDSTTYADPAWQGRATTKAYTFTIDLGGLQVIREVRSHWLQDMPSGILLPQRISYSVSSDNMNFVAVGTVAKPMPIESNRAWWYTLTDLANVNGRYVQIRVSPGSNAGWTFIDEIEVRQ